jgi:hypothetical protein
MKVLSPPELDQVDKQLEDKSDVYTPWFADDMLTSGFLRVPISPDVVADNLVVVLRKWVEEKRVDFEVKNNTIVGRVFDGKFTNMASFHISIHSIPQHHKNANDIDIDDVYPKCVVYVRRQDNGDFFLYSRFESKLVSFLQNLSQVVHKVDESLIQVLQHDDNHTWTSDDGKQVEDKDDDEVLFQSMLPSKEENSDSQYVKQLLEEACHTLASPEMSYHALDDLLTLLDNRREYFQKNLPCDAELVVQELVGVALQSLDVQQVRGLVQMVLSMIEERIVSTMQEETREKVQESLKKLQEMWLQGREKGFGSEETCFFTFRVFPSQQVVAICEECLTRL